MTSEDPVDKEKQYPWGTKTITYEIFVILFAINVIALTVLFLIYVEIPLIQGHEIIDFNIDAFAQVNDKPIVDKPFDDPTGNEKTEEKRFIVNCLMIITGNTAAVLVTKTVGRWAHGIERRCERRNCIWWCLCCNKWHCWLVKVVKWVTYVITIISTVVTTALIWICSFGVLQF